MVIVMSVALTDPQGPKDLLRQSKPLILCRLGKLIIKSRKLLEQTLDQRMPVVHPRRRLSNLLMDCAIGILA